MPFLITDIETTGLSPRSDDIVEIVAVRCSDDTIYPIMKFHAMCNPECGIKKESEKINNISEGMVKYAESSNVVLSDLKKIIRPSDIIVGHNILGFDIKFLERDGVKINNTIIDTLEMAKKLGFKNGERSLTKLAEKLEVKAKGSPHRADYDVEITRQIFKKLREMELGNNKLF